MTGLSHYICQCPCSNNTRYHGNVCRHDGAHRNTYNNDRAYHDVHQSFLP